MSHHQLSLMMKQAPGIPIDVPPQYVSCQDLVLPPNSMIQQPLGQRYRSSSAVSSPSLANTTLAMLPPSRRSISHARTASTSQQSTSDSTESWHEPPQDPSSWPMPHNFSMEAFLENALGTSGHPIIPGGAIFWPSSVGPYVNSYHQYQGNLLPNNLSNSEHSFPTSPSLSVTKGIANIELQVTDGRFGALADKQDATTATAEKDNPANCQESHPANGRATQFDECGRHEPRAPNGNSSPDKAIDLCRSDDEIQILHWHTSSHRDASEPKKRRKKRKRREGSRSNSCVDDQSTDPADKFSSTSGNAVAVELSGQKPGIPKIGEISDSINLPHISLQDENPMAPSSDQTSCVSQAHAAASLETLPPPPPEKKSRMDLSETAGAVSREASVTRLLSDALNVSKSAVQKHLSSQDSARAGADLSSSITSSALLSKVGCEQAKPSHKTEKVAKRGRPSKSQSKQDSEAPSTKRRNVEKGPSISKKAVSSSDHALNNSRKPSASKMKSSQIPRSQLPSPSLNQDLNPKDPPSIHGANNRSSDIQQQVVLGNIPPVGTQHGSVPCESSQSCNPTTSGSTTHNSATEPGSQRPQSISSGLTPAPLPAPLPPTHLIHPIQAGVSELRPISAHEVDRRALYNVPQWPGRTSHPSDITSSNASKLASSATNAPLTGQMNRFSRPEILRAANMKCEPNRSRTPPVAIMHSMQALRPEFGQWSSDISRNTDQHQQMQTPPMLLKPQSPRQPPSLKAQAEQHPPEAPPTPFSLTENMILDMAHHCRNHFPFSLIAERHNTTVAKVNEIYNSVFHLPALKAGCEAGLKVLEQKMKSPGELAGITSVSVDEKRGDVNPCGGYGVAAGGRDGQRLGK
jgi:hypothetical protein